MTSWMKLARILILIASVLRLFGWAYSAQDYSLAKGDLYFNRGDYKKAIKEYKKALKKARDNPEIHFKIGKAHSRLKQYPEAILSYQKVISLNPNHREAYKHLAEDSRSLQRYDLAAQAYGKLLELDPDDHMIHFELGSVLLAQNKVEDAIQQFKAATRIHPGFQEAYAKLEDIYKRLLLADPDNIDLYMELGRIYSSLKRYSESITQYTQVIRLNPQHKAAYEHLAEDAKLAGKYDVAISAYKELISLDPSDHRIHAQLGLTYMRQGEYAKAIEHLVTSARLKPDEAPNLYPILGDLYKQIKDTSYAYYYYKKYLQLSPTADRSKDLRDWLENEELVDIKVRDRFQALELLNEGIAAFNSAKLDVARAKFSEAIKLYSSRPEIYYWLGRTYYELGLYQEAISAYVKAAGMQADPKYHYELGRAYWKNNDPMKAREELNRAVELDPLNEHGVKEKSVELLTTIFK